MSSAVTDFEKFIYNCYLSAIAKVNNRPFRTRKNFEGIEDEKYNTLKRLSDFFGKNELDVEDFFHAPFMVYSDEAYKPLTYYTTPDAVSAYTRYKKKQETCKDEDKLIDYTMKGFKFLIRYCIDEGITLNQYSRRMNNAGIPVCMVHLKEHKINFYVIHTLENRDVIYKLDREWREFYVRGFDDLFRSTFRIFSYSIQLKDKIRKAKSIIETKLKDNNEHNINV
jgi:hypothetical protein